MLGCYGVRVRVRVRSRNPIKKHEPLYCFFLISYTACAAVKRRPSALTRTPVEIRVRVRVRVKRRPSALIRTPVEILVLLKRISATRLASSRDSEGSPIGLG